MSSHPPSNQSQSPENSLSQRLGIIVILALTAFGGLIGSYLLGPYGLKNAIPSPYIVGFGFGALPTFVLMLVVRFTIRYSEKN